MARAADLSPYSIQDAVTICRSHAGLVEREIEGAKVTAIGYEQGFEGCPDIMEWWGILGKEYNRSDRLIVEYVAKRLGRPPAPPVHVK